MVWLRARSGRCLAVTLPACVPVRAAARVCPSPRAAALLSDVKLGGNMITSVAKDAFQGLPELTKYYGRLCLENNPLNCCGLEWLRKVGRCHH